MPVCVSERAQTISATPNCDTMVCMHVAPTMLMSECVGIEAAHAQTRTTGLACSLPAGQRQNHEYIGFASRV